MRGRGASRPGTRSRALVGLLAGSALAAALAGCAQSRHGADAARQNLPAPSAAWPQPPSPPSPPPVVATAVSWPAEEPPDLEAEVVSATAASQSIEVAILTRRDLDRLADVMRRTALGRPDALHLDVRVRLPVVGAALIRLAGRIGVDRSKIRLLAEPVHDPASLAEVILTRWIALAPPCRSAEIRGPSFLNNDFSPDLSCSTARNLAAMLNDPGVLQGNDTILPADGARGVIAIERYRNAPNTVANASHAPYAPDGAPSRSPVTASETASAAILGSR